MNFALFICTLFIKIRCLLLRCRLINVSNSQIQWAHVTFVRKKPRLSFYMRKGYISSNLKFYKLPFWTYGLEQDGQTDGQHQCVLWFCFDEEQYFLKKQKTQTTGK